MREHSFRRNIVMWLIGLLERHTPAIVRSMQIQILMGVTAKSFGVPSKSIWFMPPQKALDYYARFTVDSVKKAKNSPMRLYTNAYHLGCKIRKINGFTDDADISRFIIYLYKNIGIKMFIEYPDELRIPQCFFSKYYTPGQCHLMSYVDVGIITGLYGKGHLEFSERLTEGCSMCRACFAQGRNKTWTTGPTKNQQLL